MAPDLLYITVPQMLHLPALHLHYSHILVLYKETHGINVYPIQTAKYKASNTHGQISKKAVM